MTDQERVPRFPDGEPVGPLHRPQRASFIGVTALVLVLVVIGVSAYLITTEFLQ